MEESYMRKVVVYVARFVGVIWFVLCIAVVFTNSESNQIAYIFLSFLGAVPFFIKVKPKKIYNNDSDAGRQQREHEVIDEDKPKKKTFHFTPGSKLFNLTTVIVFVMSFVVSQFSSEIGTGLFLVAMVMLVMLLFKFAKEKKARREREERERLERLESSEVVQAFYAIERGELPVFRNSPVIRKDEPTHFHCHALRYIIKNRVVGYEGGSAGASFRVAKGVTIRTGGFKGSPIRADVKDTFLGEFVLTNKRLVFIHGQQGFESTLDTIGIIKDFGEGKVLIQKGNNTCILRLVVEVNVKTGFHTCFKEGAADMIINAISLIREQENASKR